jgi:hypothetical protein
VSLSDSKRAVTSLQRSVCIPGCPVEPSYERNDKNDNAPGQHVTVGQCCFEADSADVIFGQYPLKAGSSELSNGASFRLSRDVIFVVLKNVSCGPCGLNHLADIIVI